MAGSSVNLGNAGVSSQPTIEFKPETAENNEQLFDQILTANVQIRASLIDPQSTSLFGPKDPVEEQIETEIKEAESDDPEGLAAEQAISGLFT